MQLVPSVTTVLSVVSKPQLEVWKVKQGILSALTLTREDGEADDSYIARVLDDSKRQAIEAAQEGTRIHDAIEASFAGRWYPEVYRPHVTAAREALAEAFPTVTDWIAEQSFASPLGFGGKVDLFSPSTGIAVDWKGKDGDFSDGKRLAYDQHWQLAAYRYGLGHGPGVVANGFVSRTHPGKVKLHLWSDTECQQGLDVFKAALGLWKAIKGYDSQFPRRVDNE
jgi:hypothetical protein